MGFEFYLCHECLQINCTSDGGDHKCKPKRKKDKQKYIDQLEADMCVEFGTYYLSEKHLGYFHTFYDAVDWWQKNRDKKETEEYKDKTNLIKSFFYGCDYQNNDIKMTIKQSSKDIKEAIKVYGRNPVK